MRHFGIGQWTDFVCGLAGADEAEMRQHLAAGCESCERLVTALRRIADGDRSDEQSAAARVGHGPVVRAVIAERQVLDLVWDSARAPWLAGENGGDGRRELHFANSEYELDARVEDAPDGGATLSGRLHSRFHVDVDNLQVRLVSERQVLDSGATGDLGEFELPLIEDDALELQIALRDDRRLIATLDD